MTSLLSPDATRSGAPQVRFEPMTVPHLAAVSSVESQAHLHPWHQRNFADCLDSGYLAQLLLAEHRILGYFVAMKGFEEVHLLNITVAPEYQRQGWAKVMLEALSVWSQGQGAHCLWLEARAGNTRALQVYKAHGFTYVGHRQAYYPAAGGQREDALVMSKTL